MRALKKPDASLVGRWLGVEVFLGGGCCPGCCHGMLTARAALFSTWEHSGKLERPLKKTPKIAVVLGRGVSRSPTWDKKVVVVGDCAASHKSVGIFVPECPPFPPVIAKAMNLAVASESEKSVKKPMNLLIAGQCDESLL